MSIRKFTIVAFAMLPLLGGCHEAAPQLPAPVAEVFDKEGNPVAMPQAESGGGYSGTEMLMMGAAAGLIGNQMGKSSTAGKGSTTVIREKTVIREQMQPRPRYQTQPRRPTSTFRSSTSVRSFRR